MNNIYRNGRQPSDPIPYEQFKAIIYAMPGKITEFRLRFPEHWIRFQQEEQV